LFIRFVYIVFCCLFLAGLLAAFSDLASYK